MNRGVVRAYFKACLWLGSASVVVTESLQQWSASMQVMCNGQKHMNLFRNQRKSSVMEAVCWVCLRMSENHEWISEISFAMQENTIFGSTENGHLMSHICAVEDVVVLCADQPRQRLAQKRILEKYN